MRPLTDPSSQRQVYYHDHQAGGQGKFALLTSNQMMNQEKEEGKNSEEQKIQTAVFLPSPPPFASPRIRFKVITPSMRLTDRFFQDFSFCSLSLSWTGGGGTTCDALQVRVQGSLKVQFCRSDQPISRSREKAAILSLAIILALAILGVGLVLYERRVRREAGW